MTHSTPLGYLCKHLPRAGARLLLSLSLLCSSYALQGQMVRDTMIERISTDILYLIKTNLNDPPVETTSAEVPAVDSFFNLINPNFELADQDWVHQKNIEKLKKDFGLDIRASYFYNSDHIFEEDYQPTGQLTRSRVRAGLEWSILREGWQSNQNRIRQVEHQRDIDALEAQLRKNDERLYFRYNLFIYFFNKAKIELLHKRRLQLNKELELLYQVYFLKGILYEQIINLKSRIEQINVQLENYQKYNLWAEATLDVSSLRRQFDVQDWPILEVDLDYLAKDPGKEQLLDSIDLLALQIEELKNSPVNEVSLRLQADQNLNYADDGISDRSFMSFRLALGIPTAVLFNRNSKQEMVLAKSAQRNQFRKYEHLNTQTELINYHYEYNYKLKQYVEFLHKRLLYKEKIRVETIDQKNYVDIYRSLRILRYMDDLRSIELESLDIKQQMYLQLLKIYGKTHYRSIVDFVRPVDVSNYFERLPGGRTLVLESNEWKRHDANFIKNYLLSNDFEQVVIETGNPMQKEIQLLSAMLQKKGIRVQVIIDNPQLLEVSSELAANNVAQYLEMGRYDGAVLDLGDGRAIGTAARIDRFVRLQRLVKQQRSSKAGIGLKIRADFPYLGLLAPVDQLILRVPEPTNFRLLEAIITNPAIDPQKLTLSVEAGKFKDRMQLELFIEQMVERYKINNIIIEGLSNFIALDTKILVKTE
ncbi:MAG: hypothetical protein AAGG75_17015 [Bacteroidota bacterium]